MKIDENTVFGSLPDLDAALGERIEEQESDAYHVNIMQLSEIAFALRACIRLADAEIEVQKLRIEELERLK